MEGKKGSKDDYKALTLNNWKDRAAIYSDVKMRMDWFKCFKMKSHKYYKKFLEEKVQVQNENVQ